MPWKLIGILSILTLFLVFAWFNTHLVTIYFGPVKVENIPMFVSLFFSFLSGAIIALPFSLISSIKKKKKIKQQLKEKNELLKEEIKEGRDRNAYIESNHGKENGGTYDGPLDDKEEEKTVKKSKKKRK
ncbi:MAG: DUF1049 domain-containing protein [Spirochaetales bacterium]|nr:DUF1049 domain-containing protein [Spirochaetales bacterium]